jgi:hypothetical protein
VTSSALTELVDPAAVTVMLSTLADDGTNTWT